MGRRKCHWVGRAGDEEEKGTEEVEKELMGKKCVGKRKEWMGRRGKGHRKWGKKGMKN